MSLLKGKGKSGRRKAEHELMETTLGMLHGQNEKTPPTSPSATATLPSRWQPGQHQQRPRPQGRGQQRGLPPVGYRNGTASRPYNSLSSTSSIPSPRSSMSPPRSPGSPNSISSLDSQQRKFGTWAPAAPMGTRPAPATLSYGAPQNRPQQSQHTRPQQAPLTFEAPPDPLQQPLKPPMTTDKKPGRGINPALKSTKSPPPSGYRPLHKNVYHKETFVQRHKCLVVSLAILFILCFIIAIVVFAIGASGVFGKYFQKKANVVDHLNDNCTYSCEKNSTYPRSPLIVIALDGFRYSYLETFDRELPNINTLANCGVQAQMLASFPATTSPNLWTIVSGYYPQFHGIVSDWIRDYETGEEFDPRTNPTGPATRDAGWFHDFALWEIARMQGKITASQHWLGDTLGVVEDDHHLGEFVDRSPTYVDKFDRSRNYTTRMKQVVDWLGLPINKRPELITVYFEDPGQKARTYGSDDIEVREVLGDIDGAIGYLRGQLSKDDALGCVNIILVSTSGIEDISCDRVYYLSSDIQDINDFIISPDYLGSMARITAREEAPDDMNSPAEIVDHLQCNVDHGQAYLTDFIPYRLHGAYGHHLEENVVMMDDGWTFAARRSGHDPENCNGANDGYDPFAEKMKGVFIGSGRDFKIGESVLPFQNIELFNLMSELIDVEPLYDAPPSDGSKGMLYEALTNPPKLQQEKWNLARPSAEQMCQFPETRRRETAGCSCTPNDLNEYAGTEDMTFAEMDETLNHDIQGSTQFNAPFGIPGVRDDINSNGEYFCYLYQDDYITSFDRFLKIPTFISFTLNSNTRNVNMDKAGLTCIRYDQRLDPSITPKCSDYNFDLDRYQDIIMNVLYQPSLAPGVNAVFDSQITSNIVPQYRNFASEIWSRIYDMVWNWAGTSDQVNIVVGPAYDMDRDSKKDSYYKLAESIMWVGDTPLPTHYYVVATRCQVNGTATSLRGCKPGDLQFIAYIFAHVNEIPSCFNFARYLRNNLATLRDVEKLTGILFFPEMSLSSDEETRLKMVRLKTLYPYDSYWTGL